VAHRHRRSVADKPASVDLSTAGVANSIDAPKRAGVRPQRERDP
jgi:hypothetical protein